MDELQQQTAAGQSECLHSELSYKQVRQGSFRWPPIMDGVMTGRSALQGSALARLAVDAMLAGICIDLFEALVPIKLRELYANRPP